MMRTRYLIEIGSGADLHGENATKAAQKAVKDAISHCCICGTVEIPAQYHMSSSLDIQIKVAVPHHETVNHNAILTMLSAENTRLSLEIVEGGLSVPGFNALEFGTGTEILVANAAVTIYIVDHRT